MALQQNSTSSQLRTVVAAGTLGALAASLMAVPAHAAAVCDGLVNSGPDFRAEITCASDSDTPTTLTLTNDIIIGTDDNAAYGGHQDLSIDGAGHTVSPAVATTNVPFLTVVGSSTATQIKVENLTVTGFANARALAIQGAEVFTLSNSTFTNNGTGGAGGAVRTHVPTVISGSTFTGNGGGYGSVIDTGSPLRIENSTIARNSAGATVIEATADLEIVASTIAGNTAQNDYVVYTSTTGTVPHIENSTIVNNTSPSAVLRLSGNANNAASIVHSTFANKASDSTPYFRAEIDVELTGNVFASTSDVSSCIASPGLTITSQYNFDADGTCTNDWAGTGNIGQGLDAKLGALANNGGRTQTMAPLKNSPLLNKVPAAATGLTHDQRGQARPAGAASDMGAVEFQPAPAPDPKPGPKPGPKSVNLIDVSSNKNSKHYTQFHTQIQWLADQGITRGWAVGGGKHEFRPKQEITREAMAAFMYRYAGSPAVKLPAKSPFKDVTPANTNFYKEIVWMNQQGISTGWNMGGGTKEFRPKDNITRDAMAAFMYRFAGKPTTKAPAVSPFSDVTPKTQFYKEITWLSNSGISTGWTQPKGKAQYRPFDQISREAMAAFLYRLDRL